MTTTETTLARTARLLHAHGTATLELAPGLTVDLTTERTAGGIVLATELVVVSSRATTRVRTAPVPLPAQDASPAPLLTAALSALAAALPEVDLLLGQANGTLDRLGYEDRVAHRAGDTETARG